MTSTASSPSPRRSLRALPLALMVAAAATQAQPATYTGTLPCADCAGIVTELTLVPAADSAPARYRLREVYLTRRPGEHEFNSAGRWRAARGLPGNPQAQVIVLDGDAGAPPGGRRFVRLAPDVLDAVGGDGWRLPEALPGRLRRAAQPAQREAPLQRFAGTLRQAADGGWMLQPCDGSRAVAAADASPQAQLAAVLAELGFGRLPQIHLDAWGRREPGSDRLLLQRLNRAGTEMRCAPPALQFTAQGNEPDWQLAADARGLTLRRPPSARQWPAAALHWQWRGDRPDQAGARLATRSGAGILQLTLTPGLCRDSMADAAYGFRAQLQLARSAPGRQDARRHELDGCAYLGSEALP